MNDSVKDRPIERIAYSPGELAAALGCARAHVNNLIARGEIPSFKLGRRRMIPADVVARLMGKTYGDTPGADRARPGR